MMGPESYLAADSAGSGAHFIDRCPVGYSGSTEKCLERSPLAAESCADYADFDDMQIVSKAPITSDNDIHF